MTRNWLNHLEGAIPQSAYGYKLCIYAIALEGWRRGLGLKFYNFYRKEKGLLKHTIRFALSNDEKEHHFAVSRGDLVSKEAIQICIDKHLTKSYMEKAGVSAPAGKSFTAEDSDNTILNYFSELDFPVVLKPTDAGGGKGVITNIKTEEELKEAIAHVRHDLGYKEVLLEAFIKGKDHRVYVIDNQVLAVYMRLAANVVGDGDSTIDQLIDKKNKARKENPYLAGRLIKKDQEMLNYLRRKGLSLNSVPMAEERVFVREKGSLSAGGEPIDITDKVSNELKQTAINAAKAIPGLPQCAIDMIVDENTGKGFVNEVNSKPQISNHLFPVEGIARDIPSAIIDYYFPETINSERRSEVYIDFDAMLQGLHVGSVKEMVVPSLNYKLASSFKATFDNIEKPLKTKKEIRSRARDKKLFGEIYQKNKGSFEVRITGRKSIVEELKEEISTRFSNNLSVITENKEPIKVGFDIAAEKKTYKELEAEIRSLKHVNTELENKVKEYEAIKNN